MTAAETTAEIAVRYPHRTARGDRPAKLSPGMDTGAPVEALLFVVGVVAGLILARLYRATPVAPAVIADASPPQVDTAAEEDKSEAKAPIETSAATDETPADQLLRLIRAIDAVDERIQRPQDLLALPEFHQGVDLLASEAFSAEELVRQLGGTGYVQQSMITRVLPRRGDIALAPVLEHAAQFGGYPLHFLIDYLRTRGDAQALPHLMRHAQPWWWDFAPVRQQLRDYLQWAQQFGEAPAAPALDELEEAQASQLRDTLKRFASPLLDPLLAQVERARDRHLPRHRCADGIVRAPAPPHPHPGAVAPGR